MFRGTFGRWIGLYCNNSNSGNNNNTRISLERAFAPCFRTYLVHHPAMSPLQEAKKPRVPREILDLDVAGEGAFEQRDRVSGGHIDAAKHDP